MTDYANDLTALWIATLGALVWAVLVIALYDAPDADTSRLDDHPTNQEPVS